MAGKAYPSTKPNHPPPTMNGATAAKPNQEEFTGRSSSPIVTVVLSVVVKTGVVSSMDQRKRKMVPEEVSNWLKEENRQLVARRKVLNQIDKLYGEVTAMKDVEKMRSKAEQKCRDLESEKGKLEMDLKAAMAENKAILRTLDEKVAVITTLIDENEHLDQEQMKIDEDLARRLHRLNETMHKIEQGVIVLKRENTEKKAKVIKLEKEINIWKRQVVDKKVAMRIEEMKMTYSVQRIKVLEEENSTLKAEKEEGDKKILELSEKFDVLDKEKQRLEEELMQRIDVIKVLVQEKECMDAKLQHLKTEINKWTVSVKLEDNADLPQNNLFASRVSQQSQDKQSAKRARAST